MAATTYEYFNSQGINTYINPVTTDGQLIHAVNVVSYPYGAKSKRTGYSTFLGTPDTDSVNSLFTFPNIGNDPAAYNIYRASGSLLYYSLQGTGAWTICGNGTITDGAYVGHCVLNNTLIIGDGAGSTRHTTNGTSFTNTTLAPVGQFFEEYQRRVYIAGTSQTVFYSTTNDATNWSTSGTSDSSSFQVPGAGKMGRIFKSSDKLVLTKRPSGLMFKWDGYSLLDMATTYGPSSPVSVGEVEGYRFFVNDLGIYGYGGGKPELLSNSVQNYFYNTDNTAMAAANFSVLPAACHKYDYLLSAVSFTDNFTQRAISNAVIKYDFQKNEFLNWSTYNFANTFHSYMDEYGVRHLLMGDATGQVYTLDNSTTDNGNPIPCEMVFLYTHRQPEFSKDWRYWRGIFNPGCQAKVQIATSNTLRYSDLKWDDLGDCSSGMCEHRFPSGNNQGLFLFVRIYESSKNSRMTYYGCAITAEVEKVI